VRIDAWKKEEKGRQKKRGERAGSVEEPGESAKRSQGICTYI
jgi:hypothetical protein